MCNGGTIMKKIMIIGCPGSGKSTFSRALHKKTGIPLYHLDQMYWNADKTTVEKSVFMQRLFDTLQKEQWIIDGNYASSMEIRLQACDTVFFLDYPLDTCIEGVKSRRGKERSDMPWVEAENEEDEAFIEFIRHYESENKPKVMELLKQYSQKRIYIFKDRNEADAYLKRLR